MGEENKKTNNQVVTIVKESKTNHEKSSKWSVRQIWPSKETSKISFCEPADMSIELFVCQSVSEW